MTRTKPPCLATLAATLALAAIGSARAGDHPHAIARGSAAGTLGYGPPGLHPGFQGFGLGFHRGYGYGGAALGPGAEGGLPFYGGPGYPHPAPALRRIGGINPFPHFAGPGGPTPEQPWFYGGVGPLVADPPVLKIVGAPAESGYGDYHGMMPYPETTFAPYSSSAETGSDSAELPASASTPTP